VLVAESDGTRVVVGEPGILTMTDWQHADRTRLTGQSAPVRLHRVADGTSAAIAHRPTGRAKWCGKQWGPADAMPHIPAQLAPCRSVRRPHVRARWCGSTIRNHAAVPAINAPGSTWPC